MIRIRLLTISCLVILISACSTNKNVHFVGETLETAAFDGTLARVSINGISDGEVRAALQRTAREKFQDNKSIFSGSSAQLYTLNMSVSDPDDSVTCDSGKLSYISRGTLTTHYTLSTLDREPEQLFDVEIKTNGEDEISVLDGIVESMQCGRLTTIATDAVSRSMRIFDLLIKQSKGMDVSKALVQVQNDKDLQGSTIFMRAVSGALYAIVVPIGSAVEAAADADWSSAMSAAAKAANNLPPPTYAPAPSYRTPAPTYKRPMTTIQQPRKTQPAHTVPSHKSRPQAATRQAAAAPKKAPPQRVTIEMQTRGSTNMYFDYAQALNLATTNADTQARRQCRENYRGRIVSLNDPNMVKKDCEQNRNEQYRCVVQITHTCEYKKK